MDDYYTYRHIPVLLRGEPATLVGKPGVWSWGDVNPGSAALIDGMEVWPPHQVLDLGCGTGLIGLAAARLASEGHVTLVDVNVAAVECARQTLAENGIVNAAVRLSDGVALVEAYDVVVAHLPRGRAVTEGLIGDVVRALKPGGSFYFVAHKRAGVKSAIAYAARTLGRAGVVRQKRGYHVAMAVKGQPRTSSAPLTRDHAFQALEIVLQGARTTLIGRPGVFAWNRLDDGTAALVETMAVDSGESVLDLGCGTGILTLAAVRRGAQVMAVDADLRAVESTRRTLEANGVQAVDVLLSDCAQAVWDRRFDVVLCNPPFHQEAGIEYEVARQMVRDAATVLRPGGRLYLVSNAFIRYEREFDGRFTACKEIFNDGRYRVLKAIR